MEPAETTVTAKAADQPENLDRPALALEMEDVGDLDAVLRSYYLSQINSLEKRKDRKLARQLLENHLVLPKSRQRTSKDAAYIKEVLEIDEGLLHQLEDSRLIRRIHKSGNNPIYEVSHDTLVEPILAEKRDREAIARFIKKTWKYLVLLLLLWFLFGMLFENTFELIPAPAQAPKSIDIVMQEQVLHVDENNRTLLLPLPPLVVDQALNPSDSIWIKLPVDPIRISRLGVDGTVGPDTISIKLTSPIEVPLTANDRPVSYQTFSNVVVPLAYTGGGPENPEAQQIFAKISGNLKMTAASQLEGQPRSYDKQLQPIVMDLGDTLLRAGKSARSVPVDFTLNLTDFFTDEDDRNYVRNVLGDRRIRLNYTVQMRPARIEAPTPKVEYPSVQGIEVQYSDGTSKFIPGDDTSEANAKTHTVTTGETLFSIAKQYGIVDEDGNTSTAILRQLNGLENNILRAGQVLRLPDR